MKRLHIVGCVRSGTSLMLGCMASCFRNDGACEHEMTIFTEPEGTPDFFISKQPSDIKLVHRIIDRNPELYVIYMQRDPRAAITSIHNIDAKKYFADFTVWRAGDEAAARLAGHDRFLTLRYEDLVTDPDGMQQRIAEQFPFLEQLHPFTEYDKFNQPSFKADEAMNGMRPISNDRIRGWEKHLPRVKAQLERFPELGRLLIERGYEADDQWMEMLNEVQAEHSVSWCTEETNPLHRIEREVRYWHKSRKYGARHAK
ncbi:MAG: sulfotransferase [Verrucomicrobiota bacterium]